MKNTTIIGLLFIIGFSLSAQPFSIDSSFVSHFDFRSQSGPAVYNIYEENSGNIVINGAFQFTNGTTPHFGVVSYNRSGSLNANFVGNIGSGISATYFPINDSVYYLGDYGNGFLVDSLGQVTNQSWRNNLLLSVPCAFRFPFFFKDGSSLTSNLLHQFTGLPCDVYLPPDTFLGSYLVKIQPNGLWDSTFNVSLSGEPDVFSEYDSNRLFVIGRPHIFTHYGGQAVKGLCRIFKDGRLDSSFQSPIKDTTAINSFTIKKIDSDGSIFLIGRFYLQGYSQQFTIVKLLPNGSLDQNFMNFNGPTDTRRIANSVSAIVKTNDGGYLVGGTFNNYQGFAIRNLAKIDSLGNVDSLYFQGLGPDSSSVNGLFLSTVYSIEKSKFGGYYIGGDFLRHNGQSSQPIYRIFDLQNGVGLNEVNLTERQHKVYPNPVAEKLTIEIEINSNERMTFQVYSIDGKLLQTKLLSPGTLHQINISKLKQGIYFYQIQSKPGQFVSGKLMVM